GLRAARQVGACRLGILMAAPAAGAAVFPGATALQRILERGEIESLDHTSIPRLRQPVPALVFTDTAARLRRLAQDPPPSDYLRLLAALADAQTRSIQSCTPPGASPAIIGRAQAHGMPPLQADGWRRDPVWRAI